MANDPGAFWDQGIWDLSKWDTIAANGGWTESPDSWSSIVNLTNQLTGEVDENPDQWAGDLQLTNTVSADVIESIDIWDAFIDTHPPDVSIVDEHPDIWAAVINVTLHPPVYNSGGSWWFHYWGPRADWRDLWKNTSDAYDAWRYLVNVQVRERGDSWGGVVESYDMDVSAIHRQRELMFGSQTYVDWDDEAILEELMR